MDSTDVIARYGTQAWRYLGWTSTGLTHIARFKAQAHAAGMTEPQVEALWAAVELEQMVAPRPFSALREARQRLRTWMAAGSVLP